MKTKLYLKGLLTLGAMSVVSLQVSAQKIDPPKPKAPEAVPAPAPAPKPIHVHAHIKQTPVIGDSLILIVQAPETALFTLTITDASDAVVATLNVQGGENLLPALPIGRYAFTLTNDQEQIVENGKFEVKAPHVHAHIKPTHYVGDSLILDVHALETEVFTLTITDSADAVVATLNVHGGENLLPALPIGHYAFTLTNEQGIVVENGKFEIKAPHVHAHIKPAPVAGDSIILDVHAPETELFTLTITDSADAVVATLNVHGGENQLPALPIGHYAFTLTNGQGIVVENGKFEVKAPHVHAHIKPAPVVGDSIILHVHAPETELFTLTITDSADAVVATLNVHGGENLLPALPVGHYAFTLTNEQGIVVENGKFEVKAPHVHAHIKPAPVAGDSIILHVHAPETELFTLTITDSADAVVATLNVHGGENLLPSLPVGHYAFTLTNEQGIVVENGKFEVKAPHVHAHIKPAPVAGDSIILHVHAPETELFTLTITDSADAVVATLNVHGGENLLPSLPVGHYSFTLTNDQGYVVEKGKFDIKAPKIKSSVHPGHVHEGDSLHIHVHADALESFTLNIYSFSDELIQTLTVNGGTTPLPSLTSGLYYYELLNGEGYKVSNGKIAIHPPKVHTLIAPNPSNAGEATISVDAPSTEYFTLNIYNTADLVSSQTITGGITALPPTLDSGIHLYTVVNASGVIVSKGRIMIY
jgi:hypothetical protein